MRCGACGTENAAGRRFCDQCGAPFGPACPHCGAMDNRPAARFCGTCGGRLVGAAPASASEVATVRPLAPVAERRLVSVLFADLVGFTPFAEERDPEAVRDTLSSYFDAARSIIEAHGGMVEKFIGDAIMAVWGAPVAREDDAERAVRAALELVPAVRAIEAGLDARVGVLTGEAAVTIGATDQGMVAGDLVNAASRLQATAEPGTVLAGESTVRIVGPIVAFEPVGERVLKGRTTPLPVWRAVRVTSDRAQGSGDLPEPPFVGRDAELRLLKDLVREVGRDRRIRLVSVTGPAGIGKSRLAGELGTYLDGLVETFHWHRGRSPAYGEGIAFWALGEMVRRRAGLAEADDETTTRSRIADMADRFIADEADRRFVEPALLTLLGIGPPPGGRERLFAAWRIFFERIAATGTTILVFEDLHWADPGLLDFIDHLVEWSSDAPILVITLARPELLERRPGWGSDRRGSTAFGLEPLGAPDMRELLAGTVPGLPEPAIERIVERAAGVPLYAVEMVRMLLADGRIERGPAGRYRPVGDLGALAVPDSLRSLIASRLDALEPADRALLQEAAILGQTFTAGSLAEVSGIEEGELSGRLRGLARRDLLDVVADPRSPERGQYVFVQALIREVAYGSMSRRDRRAKHLAAARVFERLDDEELAGALAVHYFAAHEASEPGPEADAVAAEARIALLSAAERAASLGGHDQALLHLDQALGITTAASERAVLLERAAVEGDLAGRYEAAIERATEAVARYREVGDGSGAARAAGVLGAVLMDAHRVSDGAAVLEGAIASLPDDAHEALRADLDARLSRAYFRLRRWNEAVAAADRALVVAERDELEPIIAEALVDKGSALGESGRLREGTALLAAAVDLADECGNVALWLRARNNLSVMLAFDQPDRAYELGETQLDDALRLGLRQQLNWKVSQQALNAILMARGWDDELSRVASALDEVADADRALLLGNSYWIHYLQGRPDPDAAAESLRLTLDPSWLAEGRAEVDGLEAWSSGDLRAAADAFARAARAGSQVSIILLGFSANLACWAGDQARVEVVLRAMNDDPTPGRQGRAQRAAGRAMLDALEGRTEAALAGFRAAIDLSRLMTLDLFVAIFGLTALTALPGSPEVRAWAEEARAILERVDARLILDRLETELAARTAAVP
jgi:class 3 adenylate cyclase/tetratricopeptide (TPR) repeat protein